jgi:broad specificity phosphatase PhoE
MLDLLLTRHGLTTAGENAVLGGQIDVSLTPEGLAQAEALARRLAGVRIDRIISSPMIRALETAQAIATGRPVEVDERLRELDYGRWEGLTSAEIDARDPELRARWDRDPASTRPPGGESGDEVAARAVSFLADLLAADSRAPAAGRARGRSPEPGGSRGVISETQAEAEGERRILVVAHGTFNRILMCAALGIPVRDCRRRFVQDRANLTVLRYEYGDGPDGAQLILGNDVAHLRRPGEAPWG